MLLDGVVPITYREIAINKTEDWQRSKTEQTLKQKHPPLFSCQCDTCLPISDDQTDRPCSSYSGYLLLTSTCWLWINQTPPVLGSKRFFRLTANAWLPFVWRMWMQCHLEGIYCVTSDSGTLTLPVWIGCRMNLFWDRQHRSVVLIVHYDYKPPIAQVARPQKYTIR